MATEIAKAYVQIVPSMKGVSGQIENELGGAGDGAGKKAGSSFLSGVGSAIKGGAKVLGASIAAASVGLGKIVADSVGNYADYEQLSGGIETLFKENAGDVMESAQNAFQTAGISANEYMETVTSFSASLITSLGGNTAEAAKYADMAITDMSDNANKMGTSMEAIQNAYQGFAKQNYTMLDNLKLGYGGTKEEMARLLEDAEAISGVHFDISSYADVVEAIHTIQESMDIAGTTSAEAEGTISGSISMLQASVTNLITGLGSAESDMGALAQNVADSFSLVIQNIAPVVENIVSALPTAFETLITAMFDLLPTLLNTVTSLFSSALSMLTDSLPKLIPVIVDAVMLIVHTLVDNLPMLIEAALEIILALASGISDALPELIPTLVETMVTIVTGLLDNLPKLVEAALTLILALGEGLIKAIPELIKSVPQIMQSIVTALVGGISQLWDVGKQIVNGIWQGILKAKDAFVASVKNFFSGILDSVKSFLGIASPSKVFRDQIGKQMAAGIGVGFSNEIGAVQREIVGDVDGMMSSISGTTVGLNANVNAASGVVDEASLDRLVAAIGDTAEHIHVYLDSKEIRTGQRRLARAVG